jgi:hypothetical protein
VIARRIPISQSVIPLKIAMSATSQTFWAVRRGNRPEEYEDAFAADDAAARYAVADGATESCFAGLWARLLAEGFVQTRAAEGQRRNGGETAADRDLPVSATLECAPAGDPFFPSLAALQERWDTAIRERRLAWYSEPAIKRGAFATFLGLTIWEQTGSGKMGGERERADDDAAPTSINISPSPPFPVSPSPRYRWAATAVGDACLFHTRGDQLLHAFPLERAGQFDNLPKLVGSRMSAEAFLERRRQWTDGTGHAGDRLWMMTDALAQWCLTEQEAWEKEGERGRGEEGGSGRVGEGERLRCPACSPWSGLTSLLSGPEAASRFDAWIDQLRESGRLKNDDVTLLAISLEASK